MKSFELWEIEAMINHQINVNNEYKKRSGKKTVSKSNDLTKFILEE